jgi:archaemetzincin
MLVRVIPVGKPPASVIEALVSELPAYTGARARVLPALPVPKETFNHWRKQYNAEQMMSILCKVQMAKFIDKSVPTLFITEEDIYYDGLNFVFGVEDPVLSASMVSTARLRPEFYDQKPDATVSTERAVKECIHEVGHHMGLEHCRHPTCVMSYSPSADDVDVKKKDFCADCKVKASMKGVSLE